MKKILTILLILFISQVCFAGRLQEMQKAVIAAKNGAGGGETCDGQCRYVNPGADAGGDGTTAALTGANAAFTTLAAAEAALGSGTLTENWTIYCAGSTADTTAVTFTGYTPSTYTVTVIGDWAPPATGANWSDSYYHLLTPDYSEGITVSVNNVILKNLQVRANNNGNYRIAINISGAITGVDVANCIVKPHPSYAYSYGIQVTGGAVARIWNCIAYDFAYNGFNFDYNGTGNVIYNCTAVNCGGSGFNKGGGAILALIINCLSDDNTTSDYGGTWHASSANNMSGDASAPGGNSQEGNHVVFVDQANKNFHLDDSDTIATDTGDGTTPSGIFDDDIDGDNRPATAGDWDIGADENV